MIRLKKFFGNYIQLVRQLDLPTAFLEAQELKIYTDQLALDLPRYCYLSDKYSIHEMKMGLYNISHLFDAKKGVLYDNNKPLSYVQGNFNAAVFNVTILSKIIAQMSKTDLDDIEIEGFYGHWSTIYVDDDDVYSGISVSYLRHDPALEPSEPIGENRKRDYFFSICVIKNVNFAPSDRQVVYLSHPALLTSGINATRAEDIKVTELVNDLAPIINSRLVNPLIANLFSGGLFSLKKFNELKNQYRSNYNNYVHFIPRNLSDLLIMVGSIVLAVGLPLISLPLILTNILIPPIAITTLFFASLVFLSVSRIIYNEFIFWSDLLSLTSTCQTRYEKKIHKVEPLDAENQNCLSGFPNMFHLIDTLASFSTAAEEAQNQITDLLNQANDNAKKTITEEYDSLPSVGYGAH